LRAFAAADLYLAAGISFACDLDPVPYGGGRSLAYLLHFGHCIDIPMVAVSLLSRRKDRLMGSDDQLFLFTHFREFTFLG